MPKKKYKRLTATEKRLRKEAKQELIAKGVLPPPKKPLNRKALCREVHAALKTPGMNIFRLREAVGWMLPMENTSIPITPEQVGVMKLILIAAEIERFWQEKKDAGETSASIDDMYKAIKPILER